MQLPEPLAHEMIDAHLVQRIELMSSLAPGVRVLLEAALASVTKQVSIGVQTARKKEMDEWWARELFNREQETGDLQRLFRLHADDEWPASFTHEVAAARRDPAVAPYLCPQSHGFHDGVINAPVIFALDAVSGASRHRLRDRTTISAIRTHRTFDPHWFDEAFGFTIARCISTGKISFDA
jgi:hypothetical protein